MMILLELKGILKSKAGHTTTKEIRKIELNGGGKVIDIFKNINLPKENVSLVTVNGKVRDRESVLKENDKVVLYPPIGGG